MITGIIVFWLGASLDVYTTKRALLDGPMGFRELNPIARFFLKWGVSGLIAVKLIVFVWFAWMGLQPGAAASVGGALWLLGAAQLIIGANNWRLIRRRKGN